MNLVLFETNELEAPLAVSDRRAQHILEVLHRKVGDTFDAGVINGSRGRGTVTQITATALSFAFDPVLPPTPPAPITMIIGLPRPQTARDILRDATTLGVEALHFVRTEKGEPNYRQSTLWSSGEWRRHALAGAEQAFDTHLPVVTHGTPLNAAIAQSIGTNTDATVKIALDNYEAAGPLSAVTIRPDSRVIIAIGSERGWSAAERDLLRGNEFTVAHLGSRVLRAETAVVAALTLVRGKLGLL